jgi:exocyst complex protein 7
VNFVTQLSTLNSPLPLDTAEFATLRPLVAMLRTFPVPATHPTHPAAQSILSALKDVQRAYAETRGAWASKVLDGGAKRVIERADIDDGLVVGRLLGDWINTLLGLAEVSP